MTANKHSMNLQHHFLIAMPTLQDPYFQRAVVYICEHNEDGAMGLIINKPAERLTVENLLKKLSINPVPRAEGVNLDSPIFLGGPLADDRGFILHTPQDNFSSSLQISDDTMITTSKDVLKTMGTTRQPKNVLISLGYAGWEVGQLENEILENAWLTVKADPEILFNTPISERWHAAAKKLGIDIHNIALEAGHA